MPLGILFKPTPHLPVRGSSPKRGRSLTLDPSSQPPMSSSVAAAGASSDAGAPATPKAAAPPSATSSPTPPSAPEAKAKSRAAEPSTAPAAPKAPAAGAAPGLRRSFGTLKDGVGRLIGAHRALLVAELQAAGKQVALIAGLAVAALVLSLLAFVLLYVGLLLFLGEWLLGSLGWGVLDGFLLTMCFIVPIGLNLAGGWWGDWGRGLATALLIGLVVGIVLSTNILHNAAVWLAQQLQASISIQPDTLTWLAPAVLIGLLMGIVGLIAGWRMARKGAGMGLFLAAFVGGFLFGGFFGAMPFNTQVAAAFAVTAWLILWLVLSALFAVRRGLNPKKRYDKLVPRESMAQFAATRAYLEQQWQRQRKKLVGK